MPKDGCIGVDVGGTKILFELFDSKFKSIESIKVKTPGDDKAEFTDTFVESIQRLVKKARQHRIVVSAVGIGCAGTADTANGTIVISHNIPAVNGYSFANVLRKLTKARVVVHNDVKAGLY